MSRLLVFLWAGLALGPAVALAQNPPASSSAPPDLQARCAQLVAFWDRHAGETRSTFSRRNSELTNPSSARSGSLNTALSISTVSIAVSLY